MKQCKAINTATAALIIGVSSDSVQLDGVENPVVVSKNWINHQLPQPGDYLVHYDGVRTVLNSAEFNARFVFDEKADVDFIASVAHEVNRGYCAALGDNSQLPWVEAPEWQKESAVNGVLFHLESPDVTPAESHANRLVEKEVDGWVFGEVKDAEKKEHPCMVHYDDLPVDQKVKDSLFGSVVKALTA